MDLLLIGFLAVAVIGALLAIAFFTKRRQIQDQLFKLQHPPAVITSMSIAECMSAIRGVVKNHSFHGQKWAIREDNPKGMMIAVLTFDEDIANRANIAKRQLILYVSVTTEGELTKATLSYNAYSTFGRQTTDSIIRETTSEIVQRLELP